MENVDLSGNRNVRLSSILEEDSIATPASENDVTVIGKTSFPDSKMDLDNEESNPLKEALDAITNLAEDGDFEDTKDDVVSNNVSVIVDENDDHNKENEENRANEKRKSRNSGIFGLTEVVTKPEEEPEKLEEKLLDKNLENINRITDGFKERKEVIEEPCVERIYPMLGSK